jgi:hypothetical protein
VDICAKCWEDKGSGSRVERELGDFSGGKGLRSTLAMEVLVDDMKRRKVSLDNLAKINVLLFLHRGKVKGKGREMVRKTSRKCRGKLVVMASPSS